MNPASDDSRKMTQKAKACNWCFTINNYQPADITDLENVRQHKEFRYMVYQYEKGANGTPHIQGYVQFKRAMQAQWIWKRIKQNCKPQRASQNEQARDYCMKKDETYVEGPWEWGKFCGYAGERTDIEQVMSDVREGTTMIDIAESNPETYFRYGRAIREYKFLVNQQKAQQFREVHVEVIYGDAGVGKTRSVYDRYGYKDVFKLDKSERVWFDGYEGHDVLLMDDFYGWIYYGMILHILDGHPQRIEIKGGFTMANWTKVVITSNKHPSEWYSEGMTPALKRRINKITHVVKDVPVNKFL